MKNQKVVSGIIYCIGGLFVLFSICGGYMNYMAESSRLLHIGISVIILEHILDILLHHFYEKKMILQFFWISTFMLLWCCAAAFSEYRKGIENSQPCTEPLYILVWLLIAFAFWVYQIYRSNFTWIEIVPSMLRSRWTWIIAGIVLLLSLDAVRAVQVWDNAVYAEAIVRLKTWSMNGFYLPKLASHVSWGYTFFMLPAVWLFSDPYLGMSIIQIVLLIVTVLSFREVLSLLFPTMKAYEKNLYSLLFFLFPAIGGMVSNINLDYPMMLFAVWMILCYYKKYSVFYLASSILMCCTKEPAIFLYAGFAFGVWLKEFLTSSEKTVFRRVFKCMNIKQYMSLAMPISIWLSLFLSSPNSRIAGIIQMIKNKLTGVSGDDVGASAMGTGDGWSAKVTLGQGQLNTFAFVPKYIVSQMKQLFLMNFFWLFILYAFILIIIFILRQKNKKISIKNIIMEKAALLPIFFAFLFFGVIMCTYVTHPHYRYKAAAYPLLFILLIAVINSFLINEKTNIIMTILLYGLFFVQTYTLIDPMARCLGAEMDTGRGKILSTSAKTEGTFSDAVMYSKQGADWGTFLQKVLREIDYNENTFFLLPAHEEDLDYRIFCGVYYNEIYYNSSTKLFSTAQYGNEGTPITLLKLVDTGELFLVDRAMAVYKLDLNELDRQSEIYYLELPFYNNYNLEEVLEKTGLEETGRDTISYRSWATDVVRLSLSD